MDETNCRVDATRIYSSRERPPTRWTNVSRYETRASGHARMKPPPWATVARRRDEWNMCRGLHNSEGVSSKYPKDSTLTMEELADDFDSIEELADDFDCGYATFSRSS
ncbi:hypothetical protein KIN20_036388 [Parelaphostrongylus tenuis]|uniref:Uncharacterized protein n=1 Tax=Parelaphostrongylus tenuis TaxID=148309 RepID=A0AAD5RG04_PARTN|nr:hypothetical protein KIN20_036388 [Parelaphostrongylus tenuis]